MKIIACGSSRLLAIYLRTNPPQTFDYCVDNYNERKDIEGIPIVRADVLQNEEPGSFFVVVFAADSASLVQMASQLSDMGLRYKKDYSLYSDFFHDDFVEKFKRQLGWAPSEDRYRFSVSYTLNSRTPIHTLITGNWLFLEVMQQTSHCRGAIAEVGGFEGGNALCALTYAAARCQEARQYYLFDSFEGFPERSENDPEWMKKGVYTTETSAQGIADKFATFDQVTVVPGYVPATFEAIPVDLNFSLVLYDCDMYQPALDTFNFFWERLEPGGYMLVHDYETEPDGTPGVKLATDQFFSQRRLPVISFTENMMAVIKKDL